MRARPTGTVTFLFTDIEGSTALLQQLGDVQYADALAAHRRLLRDAADTHGGYEVETQGDGFLFAFQHARDAALAALEAQQAVTTHPWPVGAALHIRMGLHTGAPVVHGDGYVGLDVHRAARICQAGWGDQILLSGQTCSLVEFVLPGPASVRDLGNHRLKGILRPERVYQLLHPDLPTEFPPLRSLDSLPNNLPHQLTSFIGRDKETAEVRDLLSGHRLVTLMGTGGAGKTRLSLELAADLVDAYRDGVWLVELAPLSDPSLVPQEVASVLRVREQPGRPLEATLIEFLESKTLLLLMDNCEHLVAACADLVGRLLRSCPGLRVLATSRERLGVAGEAVYRVPSLSLPDIDRLLSTEIVAASEAVQLFVDRATAVMPGLQVTPANVALLADVCRRLDGIPLAIELAAARVKVLTLEQIARRLDDQFTLLTGGNRTLPRHQTLRAAMDWSYVLLPEKEKVLFARLAVFAGGWSLDAAEGIATGPGIAPNDMLDLVTQLVDKSLVNVEQHGGSLRYRFLEAVRQYSREKLAESGQDAATRRRHRDWFLTLAQEAEAGLRSPAQADWLKRLSLEHDNMRAALEWSMSEPHRDDSALRLAAALGRFWWMQGHFAEGRMWLESALRAREESPPAVRARAYLEAGRLAWAQSDYAAAGALFEQSLTLFRDLGDRPGIADALNMLGLISWVASDYRTARARFEETFALSANLQDQRRRAALLNNLGLVATAQAEYESARARYRESLDLYRQLSDAHGIAISLNNLGLVTLAEGDYESAQALLDESLKIRQDLGDKHNLVYSLNSLGLVAFRRGAFERAAALCDESLTLARELGNREGIANALLTLSRLSQQRGDLTAAAAQSGESLLIRRDLGDRRGIAECLERTASIWSAQDRAEGAGWLLGAAQALRASIGAPQSAAERGDGIHVLSALAERLGAGAQAAIAHGRQLSAAEAIALIVEKNA